MTKRYFKTEEKIKKKRVSQSRADREASRIRREKFLESPEYREAIERMKLTSMISSNLTTQAMVYMHANPSLASQSKQIKKELSDLSQSLVDKMMHEKMTKL